MSFKQSYRSEAVKLVFSLSNILLLCASKSIACLPREASAVNVGGKDFPVYPVCSWKGLQTFKYMGDISVHKRWNGLNSYREKCWRSCICFEAIKTMPLAEPGYFVHSRKLLKMSTGSLFSFASSFSNDSVETLKNLSKRALQESTLRTFSWRVVIQSALYLSSNTLILRRYMT